MKARSEEPPVDSDTELARLMEENAALLADLRVAGGTATAEMTARAKEISTRITEVRRVKEERAKVLLELIFRFSFTLTVTTFFSFGFLLEILQEILQEKFLCKARSTKDADITRAIDLVRAAEEVDLVFVLDATGSMRSDIEGAKNAIRNIVKRVRITNPDLKLRVACVCYHDIGDSPQHVIQDITTDIGAFSTFLDNVAVSGGGGDWAEDIAGALKLACGLPWSSATRLIFHIADMPCHGLKFHGVTGYRGRRRFDNYPGGDPTGTCPVMMLKNLKVREKLHRNVVFHEEGINIISLLHFSSRHLHFTGNGRVLLLWAHYEKHGDNDQGFQR
jgi:hypothetical protein